MSYDAIESTHVLFTLQGTVAVFVEAITVKVTKLLGQRQREKTSIQLKHLLNL